MKKSGCFVGLIVLFLITVPVNAGEPTVYLVTLSTSYAHTGMAIPLSALFYKSADTDTNWHYYGRPNNRIFNMDMDRTSGHRMMALATHTGVHQSFDYGRTWKVTTDWRMTEVSCVAFNSQNPDIIYAGSPYGFYKTVDAGSHWKQHNTGLNSIDAQFVSSIVIDAGRPARLFISTEDGVYISVDAGESWKRSKLSVRNVRTVVQHPRNPRILAAGTENNGVYFSIDGGHIWEKRDTGLMHNTIYTIAFDPDNPDVVYAGGFQTGVYKSVDGGYKWKNYFAGLPVLDIHAIAVTPGNSNLVFAGTMGQGAYVSTDAGKTWQYAGIKNGYVSAIKFFK